MHLVIPDDIRAEVIDNYLGNAKKEISFVGNHKRNAYEDIISLCQDEGVVKIHLSRQGLYDILPEALFHPVDRFDSIPANEYKERFAEEVEQQRIEETNARDFFSLYDRFIFGLSSAVNGIKQTSFSDNSVLSDIICDSMPDIYKTNRFIARTIEFTPHCNSIRGDVIKITLMLRKIMADEGLKLNPFVNSQVFTDKDPKYNCQVFHEDDAPEDVYLGNCFEENVLSYDIQYWNDDFCDASFLTVVEELREYENFMNDYFMGIETVLHFSISAQTLPVRLSDDMCYNYLDYNTNL